MATNMYKKYTESLVREWPVPGGTFAGTMVQNEESGQIGVTLTARGDTVATVVVPGLVTASAPIGGVGNKPNTATVAVDGSWLFEVTGVADGDTSDGGSATPNGTLVYFDGTGLSLTDSGSDAVAGVIDDGVIVEGIAPVKIGVVL